MREIDRFETYTPNHQAHNNKDETMNKPRNLIVYETYMRVKA